MHPGSGGSRPERPRFRDSEILAEPERKIVNNGEYENGGGERMPEGHLKGSALAGVSGRGAEKEGEERDRRKEKGRGGEGNEKWRKRVNVQYVS